jgi:hypothetical protein
MRYVKNKKIVKIKKIRQARKKKFLKPFFTWFDGLWKYPFYFKRWFAQIKFERSLIVDFFLIVFVAAAALLLIDFRLWFWPVYYVIRFLFKISVILYLYLLTNYDVITLTKFFVVFYFALKLWRWNKPKKVRKGKIASSRDPPKKPKT